jgi:hypothetical protein
MCTLHNVLCGKKVKVHEILIKIDIIEDLIIL